MPLWREYGIDPGLFEDYRDGQFVLGHFGVEEGRLIAEFPAKWRKKIARMAGDYREVERKRTIRMLDKLKTALVPRVCDFDGTISWLDQAYECDKVRSFHALISNRPDERPKTIDLESVIDNADLWLAQDKDEVTRNAKELLAACRFLIRQCNRLEIIDREFVPSGGTGNKWLNPISAIASELARHNPSVSRFELHSYDPPIRGWPKGKFVGDCKRHLPSLIPKGISVGVSLWRQRAGGRQFHERVIATDIGGVLLDPGIDEGKQGEVYVLRRVRDSQEFLDRFVAGAGVYDLVDSAVVNGAA